MAQRHVEAFTGGLSFASWLLQKVRHILLSMHAGDGTFPPGGWHSRPAITCQHLRIVCKCHDLNCVHLALRSPPNPAGGALVSEML